MSCLQYEMLYIPSKEFPVIRHSSSIPTSFTGHTYSASFHLGIHKALLAFLLVCLPLERELHWVWERWTTSRRKGYKVSEYSLKK